MTTFLRMLAEQGLVNDMVNQLTQSKKKVMQAPLVVNKSNNSKKRPLIEKRRPYSTHPKPKKKK